VPIDIEMGSLIQTIHALLMVTVTGLVMMMVPTETIKKIH
jgi:hypothetical protein